MPEVASQVYKSRTGATEMGFLDRRSWFVGLRWGSGTGDLKWEGGGVGDGGNVPNPALRSLLDDSSTTYDS